MSPDEFLKVSPQFLGISFALILLGLLTENTNLFYGALILLALLIIRVRMLYTVGTLLHDTLTLLGRVLVHTVLGGLFLTVISVYAYLYRFVNRHVAHAFKSGKERTTTYVEVENISIQESLRKPW